MRFNSMEFLIFILVIYLVYWIFPSKFRKMILLLASYFFYGYYEWKYAVMLMGVSLCTFIFAKRIGHTINIRKRKNNLSICLFINIGLLAYFKYFSFIVSNMNVFIKFCMGNNTDCHISVSHMILPIGISFFSFQAIGYLIDVYMDKITVEENFINFALFLSFFPSVSSGPINKAQNLLPQIQNLDSLKIKYSETCDGIINILYGLFMKMIITDRISIFVDYVWNDYQAFGGVELITAALAYSIQIYCDFYSYSIMALGSAKLFGIELVDNFISPYFSVSIKEFWKRWHISLSTWLLDYVYIPLGGNRCSSGRKNFNLICTFFVSGIWHGANWTYVIWGLLHGIYQICGKYTLDFRQKLYSMIDINMEGFLCKSCKMIITYIWCTIAWIFFRADSIREAISYIAHIVLRWNVWRLWDGTLLSLGLSLNEWIIFFIAVDIVFMLDRMKYKTGENIDKIMRNQGMLFYNLAIIFFVVTIFIFGKYGGEYNAQNFIYFQF